MTPNSSSAQELLTIGDLAARTGLSPAVLRMWESRHGFPRARRLPSGHRRYDAAVVEQVQQVLRRRDAGVRLEAAVAGAATATPPATPSVFAELRRRHPGLGAHRLRKSTLLALSWAIEDEMRARASQGTIFGGFQKERFYRAAQARWEDLAKVSRSTMVMARFSAATDDATDDLGDGRPVRVPLEEGHPMHREWAVVCDAPDLAAVLTAWELPGQGAVADRNRVFETVWTLEASPVRDAARVCARVAADTGSAAAAPVLDRLAEDPAPDRIDLAAASQLFNRVLSYVDRAS